MNDYKILYLRWYVIPTIFFVFSLTVFENFYAFLLIFIFFLLYYFFLWLKYKNINFISIIFILWSITLWSYFWYNFNFYSKNFYKKCFIRKIFVVKDTYKLWEYIVSDDFWWTFIAKNINEWYKIWDKIKIYWMLIPTSWNLDNWEKQFFKIDFNYKKFFKIWEFQYDKFLKMKWFNWIIYTKKTYFKWKSNINFFWHIKQFIADKIRQLYINYPNKYKALIAGLLIWDKSLLNKDIYMEFIHSWLVHIIVVSWWNMMFFMIFLSFILFFLPFYIRLVIIACFLIIYAFTAGNDSSVIRALIMWLLWIIALFYWQQISTKRLLWLAFLLMLIYNPFFMLYDLWFILSFLAIIWILVFNKFQINLWKDEYIPSIIAHKISFNDLKKLSLKNTKYKIKYLSILFILKFYNNYFLPTFWASLFTAPAILFFTKQVNVLSPLASLVVIPFVPIIMFFNTIALLLLIFWLPWSYILVKINKPLLDLIFYMSYLIWNIFTLFIKF